MAQNLSMVPRPPAPWIDLKTGAPLPEFYQFIISLLSLAGGSAPASLQILTEAFFAQPQADPAAVDALSGAVATLKAQQLLKPPPVDQGPTFDRLTANDYLQRRPGPDLTSSIETLTALLLSLPRPPPPVPVTAKTPFTPTVTFATPGDLSVAYATQAAAYARFGPLVLFWVTLVFTPTYTTASSFFTVSLPPPKMTDGHWAWPIQNFGPATWPASDTQVTAFSDGTGIFLNGLKSGAGATAFTTTQITSGTQYTLFFSGFYF